MSVWLWVIKCLYLGVINFWIVIVNWEEQYQGFEIQNLQVLQLMLQFAKGHCCEKSVQALQWKLLSWCQWVGSVWPLLASVNLHFPLLLLLWHAGIEIWGRIWFRKGFALDSMLSDVYDQFLLHTLAVIGLVYSWDHMEFLYFIKFSPVIEDNVMDHQWVNLCLKIPPIPCTALPFGRQINFQLPLIDAFIKVFQIHPDRE